MTPGQNYYDDYYSENYSKQRRTRRSNISKQQDIARDGRVRPEFEEDYRSYSYSIPPPPPVPKPRQIQRRPPPPRHRPRSTYGRPRSSPGYLSGSDDGRYYDRPPGDYRRDYDYGDYDYYDDDYDRREYSRGPEKSRSMVGGGSPGSANGADRGTSKRISTSTNKSSGSSGGSRTVTIVIIVIFALLFLYLFRGPILEALQNPPPIKYQEFPEQLDFTVRKSMTLEVSPTRQNSYISYKLKTACPKDRTISTSTGEFYLQDVKKVNVQPEPSTGNPNLLSSVPEIMVWDDTRFTGTKTFIVEYTITTRFLDWSLTEEDSGLISNITTKLKTQYNHDEWRIDENHNGVLDTEDDLDNDGEWDYMIEPSNTKIQKRANELAGNDDNVYLAVKKIYDYLTSPENLNYVTTNTGLPKACTTTLAELKGDCDDYSILFVSLCRALDIPAWLELGVLYDRQTREWSGHAWAKVAIPLVSGGYASPVLDIVNKQFMIFDPYRFVEWIDTGGDDIYYGEDETRNNLDYYYHTFSYVSTGNPKIVSPNTNEFLTISLEEVGDKKRIATDDSPGLETCMLPGFEADLVLSSMIIIIILGTAQSKYRKRK